jgi:hypothetical protein
VNGYVEKDLKVIVNKTLQGNYDIKAVTKNLEKIARLK